MKKRPTNDDSDEFDVDEPEEFEESGSDWDPDDEDSSSAKKRKSRGGKLPSRKATTKKKKVEKSEDDEDDEENEDEEEEGEEEEESDEEGSGQEESGANGTTTPNISIKAYTNGSFVVLKTDLQSEGDPPLWKIDGKALLQKYVPFKQDEKTLYKNTSTYSGWTQNNRNQYAPAPVTYVQQGKKEIIIEFNRDKVKLDDDEQTPAADNEKNEAEAATATA